MKTSNRICTRMSHIAVIKVSKQFVSQNPIHNPSIHSPIHSMSSPSEGPEDHI
jgi:hypothetical protein